MTYITSNNTRRNAFDLPASFGFGSLEKQLDSLFSVIPGMFELSKSGASPSNEQAVKLRWYEKADAYLVRLDLPGVSKDDITIEIDDGSLQVAASRKFESDEKAEDSASALEYRRKFRLPELVREDAIVASYEDGVLSLTLPKTEKAKPRQIEVK